MYSHFNTEITWLIYDILLLFCAGLKESESGRITVQL